MSKPILIIELDDVLVRADGMPVPGARAFLSQAFLLFEVAIFGAGSHRDDVRASLREICLQHFGDLASELKFPSIKPLALCEISARAYRFSGCFPDAAGLLRLKTWSEGSR